MIGLGRFVREFLKLKASHDKERRIASQLPKMLDVTLRICSKVKAATQNGCGGADDFSDEIGRNMAMHKALLPVIGNEWRHRDCA